MRKFEQLLSARPYVGRERRRAGEDLIVLHHRVQAHESAHGTAGDEGALPPGNGAPASVDGCLESGYEPVHGDVAPAGDGAEFGIGKVIGRVLGQTSVVGMMIALHGGNDEGHVEEVEVFRKAPALSVGGVGVEENVVSVEHVEHGKASAGLFPVHGGQVEIGPAFFPAGEFGNGDVPEFDHKGKGVLSVLAP